MNKRIKLDKGITLIALIITIIVLLILAGVTVLMLTGENSILNKAEEAKKVQTEAEAKERVGMILSEYAIEKEKNNKTLIEFLEDKFSKQEIDAITNNEDGTYTIVINGYMVTINESKLNIEQIEEETQFRKDTRGKAKFIYTPKTEYTSSVQVSIEIDDSVKKYAIQYNTIDNNKQSSNWINYTEGSSFDVINNGIIYGRIINLDTNEIGYNFKTEITNIEKEVPKNATIEFNKKTANINETIQATIVQEDAESGIDITNCKYLVNKSQTEIGVDSTSWDSATNFSETPQTINITQSEIGTYYLHILSVDKVGNKIETVSEGISFKGALYYLNTSKFGFNDGYTNHMNGWNVVGSAVTNRIECKINTSTYAVTQNKYSMDEINKLALNFTMSTNSSAVTGTVTFGLVSSPASEEFVASKSVSYSWKSYPSNIEVDTSNLNGEYYIKILFKCTGSSGLTYSQGNATVIGK